jgi:hypothetical protein
VFEEVTVKAIDEKVDGPSGPVDGAIVIQEQLMDGLLEDKTFTPGYGEFFFAVEAEKERVNMALAVPTDAQSGPVRAELSTVSTAADDVFRAAASKDWKQVDLTVRAIRRASKSFVAGNAAQVLAAELRDAVARLDAAADARKAGATRQAAIDVSQAALDFELQHRVTADVDRDRLELWTRQVLVDAEVGDASGVTGDVVILEMIRDRVEHALEPDIATRITELIVELRTAADAEDVAAAAETAATLGDELSQP